MSMERTSRERKLLPVAILSLILCCTTLWLRIPAREKFWDAQALFKSKGTNAFPEFIRILKAGGRVPHKRQVLELLPNLRCEAMPLVPHIFPFVNSAVENDPMDELSRSTQMFLRTLDCPGFMEELLWQVNSGDSFIRSRQICSFLMDRLLVKQFLPS
jgi:hypothetical protein